MSIFNSVFTPSAARTEFSSGTNVAIAAAAAFCSAAVRVISSTRDAAASASPPPFLPPFASALAF